MTSVVKTLINRLVGMSNPFPTVAAKRKSFLTLIWKPKQLHIVFIIDECIFGPRSTHVTYSKHTYNLFDLDLPISFFKSNKAECNIPIGTLFRSHIVVMFIVLDKLGKDT